MKAYDVGKHLALTSQPNHGPRRYETDKAQKAFTQGYIDGLIAKFPPATWIVKCNKEGRIFGFLTHQEEPDAISCPTCGRRYMLENGKYISDRELTIIKRPT